MTSYLNFNPYILETSRESPQDEPAARDTQDPIVVSHSRPSADEDLLNQSVTSANEAVYPFDKDSDHDDVPMGSEHGLLSSD